MKKLLGLIGTITIAGSGMMGIVGNAPTSAKNEINYSQLNNLEKLNRIKKATPFSSPSRKIVTISEQLVVDKNNPTEFFSSLQRIIQELSNINILEFVSSLIPQGTEENSSEDNSFYRLSTEQYGYFRIPVVFRNTNNIQSQRNLELVFRTDNLYLEGFVVNVEPQGGHTGPEYNYYHFDFKSERYQPYGHPHLTQIAGTNSNNLKFSGAYRDLRIGMGDNRNISWTHIYNSFLWLSNTNNYQLDEPDYISTRTSLGQTILVTAEAIRSIELYNILRDNFINNRSIDWNNNTRENNIHRILMNWGRDSRALEQQLNQFIRINNDVSASNNNNIFRVEEIAETNDLWENLYSQGIRVALASIFLLNWYINLNCNRQQRDLNNVLNQKFCDLKPEIDKIQGKINIVRILENDSSENPWVKKGYVILGTKNGVYTIHQNDSVNKRMGDFNEEVTNIIIKNYNSAFIFTKNNLYVLKFKETDGEYWNSFKINIPFNLDDITKFKVLTNDSSENSWAKKGYVILGTKNGVYIINLKGEVGRRMSTINSEVKNIFVDPSNNFATVIFKNFEDTRYELNFKDWSYSSIRDFNHKFR
ncbi:ribosome-inactivating family protein [Spiroplasma endosymbiont of Dilophus febrilis]|uniref:ribosome-inactivating family protein n=1 Tax=Spiroplasma endosymbiont of Dilophus febrilis TaxID=3066292 RepID=UPI00313D0658